MFARYGDTRGMDYMRLNPMRTKPARQPEAVPTSFEGQCNPRDLAAGLDRLVAPAMQQGKQPFWVRLQLLAGLALNAGKHTGNQPTRLAHLDDGNDRAILVQGDEGPAQVVRLGHRGTPSVHQRRWCHLLAACPIASLGPTSEHRCIRARDRTEFFRMPRAEIGDGLGASRGGAPAPLRLTIHSRQPQREIASRRRFVVRGPIDAITTKTETIAVAMKRK